MCLLNPAAGKEKLSVKESECGLVFHYLLEVSVTLILKKPLSLFHSLCCFPASFHCVLRTFLVVLIC